MGVKRGIRLSLAVAMLVAGLALLLTPAHAQAPTDQVYVLTYDGNIDPNAERYFSRGIALAEEDGSPLVVIKLNTPGGLLSSTENIVERLLGADVPVAVYVHPPGAFAASAGTFVTAAANFAVMAEGTSIGAAAPVSADGEDLPETLSEKGHQYHRCDGGRNRREARSGQGGAYGDHHRSEGLHGVGGGGS